MKSLLIPDIHNKIQKIDQLIELVNPSEVIYLGDAFDSFGDNPLLAAATARWLKPRLHTPGHHFILGNHDANYRWPHRNWTACSGYTKDKQRAVDQILTKEDWQRTLFAVQRENWWISHAGLHPKIFCHPIQGFSDKRTWEILHEGEFKTEAGIHTPITDEQRNPDDLPSGPLWLRWQELEPIPGINQVVGHTAHPQPVTLTTEDSQNVNLDTFLQYYAILEDGTLTTHPNPFAPPVSEEIKKALQNNQNRWEAHLALQ